MKKHIALLMLLLMLIMFVSCAQSERNDMSDGSSSSPESSAVSSTASVSSVASESALSQPAEESSQPAEESSQPEESKAEVSEPEEEYRLSFEKYGIKVYEKLNIGIREDNILRAVNENGAPITEELVKSITVIAPDVIAVTRVRKDDPEKWDDDYESRLIKRNGEDIIPAGTYDGFSWNKLYGNIIKAEKEGKFYLIGKDGARLTETSFKYASVISNDTVNVSFDDRDGEYVLYRTADGGWKLAECLSDEAEKEHGEKIKAVCLELIDAVIDGDDAVMRRLMTDRCYSAYKSAVESGVPYDELGNSFYSGLVRLHDFASVFKSMADVGIGTINASEGGKSYYTLWIYCDPSVDYDLYEQQTFTVISDGKGNYRVDGLNEGWKNA